VGKFFARFGQLNSDNTTVWGISQPFHEALLFKAVDDTRYRAGFHHYVPCNLRGRQRTILVESQEAVKLWGTYLIGFIQFFGEKLSRLHEPSDLIDNIPH